MNGSCINCEVVGWGYSEKSRYEKSKIKIQSTSDNLNPQGKSKKRFELSGVRVTGSSKKIAESKVKISFFLHSEHFNHM